MPGNQIGMIGETLPTTHFQYSPFERASLWKNDSIERRRRNQLFGFWTLFLPKFVFYKISLRS
jgi:hypothetical protein